MRALAALGLLWASLAHGTPHAILSEDGTTLTLHTESCRLRELVTNLPGRATWTERGKTSEACYGVMGQAVIVYFAVDRTVVVLPARAFRPLSSM